MKGADASAAAPGVPLTALILEDSGTDLELLLLELRHAGFDPHYRHAKSESEYRSLLGGTFDVILAEYSLPQFNALEALRILQERNLRVPFIVVTGSVSEEAAVACMRNGAADYLLKDRMARLGPAIRQALDARRMREAAAEAEEQIRWQNRELMLLNRIIRACARASDELDILQAVCTETTESLDVLLTSGALFAEDSGDSLIVTAYGRDDTSGRPLVLPPLSAHGPMGARLRKLKAPLVVKEIDEHPALAVHQPFVRERIESAALVPLLQDGKTIGGLGFYSRSAEHFDTEWLTLLSSIAAEVSGALMRARLERERLRLDAAVEQSTDAVMIMSTDGTIRYANTSSERMSGRGRAEVIGSDASLLYGEQAGPAALGAMARGMATGEGWHGRVAVRRKDGSQLTADVSLSPLRDRGGSVVSYVGIARDITAELQREERSAQAQKLEAIGRLAGSVAHDFNNLLTSITGFTELLADRLAEVGEHPEELFQIQKALDRAAGLTGQLLVFGRRQALVPRVLSLNAIVEETEAILRPLLGQGVTLATDLAPLLRPVRADPGQIGQVIMNLALNARDAMPGGGTIIVGTANCDLDESAAREIHGAAAGAYALLRVKDSGTGIAPDVRPHLFEPFFTTKSEGKGTGLGLAIVFAVVQQSGGHIRIASVPGEGTTFEILLPAG